MTGVKLEFLPALVLSHIHAVAVFESN